jgi:chaperonin GroEL
VVEKEEDQCLGGERTGGQVLKRALEAPVRQIAENSAVDGEKLIHANSRACVKP